MEAVQTSNQPQEASPPSFESVWAALQEFSLKLDKQREESDREAKKRKEEYDRQMKEADLEARRRKEEADLRFEKFEKSQKRLSRQIGGLHNRFGELAEHLVAPGIHARFNELGYTFSEVAPGGVKIVEGEKTKTEIDILLQNDDTVMAVEVKTKPAVKDVEHHIKRLEILRDHRREKNDRRKIQGAIAGAIFGSEEKKAVIEAGLYVIEQSGDTMKIDIPNDFVPREW